MVPVVELERAALRLRHHLKIAVLPELKLLCGSRFFASFPENDFPGRESYLREFVPVLAEAAGKSNPREFLPEEQEQLEQMIGLFRSQPEEIVSAADKSAFDNLLAASESSPAADQVVAVSDRGRPQADESARVRCLFVEHNPDLDLPPRGRVLNLSVMASRISAKSADDDIVVRNPVNEPDDRFLEQARQSVKAARAFLARRYGLSQKKRYRLDFVIDSTGTRLTGDSLGVAFAVGAIAAVGRVEVLRERLSISTEAAFTGALTAEGKLESVDSTALKLKIYRALHSGLKYLVIPREHITEAWQYTSELEARFPGRQLELVGAESLDAVVSDPRLVPAERSSMPAHLARKAWQAKRSVWVEVPALLILGAILAYLLAPARWMPWFDDNPMYARVNKTENAIEILNRDSQLIWSKKLSGPWIGTEGFDSQWISIYDLNRDGRNEVIVLPCVDENADERGWFFCYSADGQELFRRFCAVLDKYPGDDGTTKYFPAYLNIIMIRKSPMIVTEVAACSPGRSHIRAWSANGDSLWSYINAGGSWFCLSDDFNLDGRTELYFLNFNNRTNCVALLVLDADSVYGVSPPYEDAEMELSWVEHGNQLAYILFPVTDLGNVEGELKSLYNQPAIPGICRDDTEYLKVYVCESIVSPDADIIYYLDRSFRVVSAVPVDQYVKRWHELVLKGKLPPMDPGYTTRLRDSAKYWNGTGWVSESQLRIIEGESGKAASRNK